MVTATSSAGAVTRILVDCGLSQGEKKCESVNGETFVYNPADVDAIFFTHAHTDHIGLFPRLVRDGFKGKAYATAPTRDLMPIMLEDSAMLLNLEAERCATKPVYIADDIAPAVARVEAVEYHQKITVGDATVTLFNAGHIVGSATILIEVFGRKILFTGDLGRTPAILIPDPEIPGEVDTLVTESVYGNRVHSSVEDGIAVLKSAILDTAKKKGVLLIPAFSLERTQIILSAIDTMVTNGEVPSVSVFMDSPLAAKVTEVYEHYPKFLSDAIQKKIQAGDDPFRFPSLQVTINKHASEAIDNEENPKIIIAGAGMSHGGRIRHHELRYLSDHSTTLLLVGYQVPGSLGRRLKDGEKKIDIDGKWVKVRAHIGNVDGFSAHADRNDLLNFAEAVKPKKVFVVLGETEASTFLAQRISGFLNIPTDVPREGETVELD